MEPAAPEGSAVNWPAEPAPTASAAPEATVTVLKADMDAVVAYSTAPALMFVGPVYELLLLPARISVPAPLEAKRPPPLMPPLQV